MADALFPTPAGNTPLPPVRLTSAQEDLCRRLDELYAPYGLEVQPSNMLRGAIFASRTECRRNPDWRAQAAHSLREILYPILRSRSGPGRDTVHIPDDKRTVFERYGSALLDQRILDAIGNVYNRSSNMAHHNNLSASDSGFEQILVAFENFMGQALTRQLDLHREIDQMLRGGPPSET